MSKFRPSYFYCRSAIKRLKLFQDLIRHLECWADQVKYARPLEELLLNVKIKDAIDRCQILRQEINRLVPSISTILYRAIINTKIISSQNDLEYDFEKGHQVKKEIREEYDLIEQYFDLPRSSRVSDLLMDCLERGIGFYQDQQKHALANTINPVIWVARLIGLPLFVLEEAGFKESQSILIRLYEWIIRIIVVVILIFFLTKLGVSIPWERVLQLILK